MPSTQRRTFLLFHFLSGIYCKICLMQSSRRFITSDDQNRNTSHPDSVNASLTALSRSTLFLNFFASILYWMRPVPQENLDDRGRAKSHHRQLTKFFPSHDSVSLGFLNFHFFLIGQMHVTDRHANILFSPLLFFLSSFLI